MTIYYERDGEGPDLVLVHGWGLHGGVWSEVSATLSGDFRVTTVDLPGHGRNRRPPYDFTLDTLADAVCEAAPAPAVWVGWSLGGLVALTAAMRQPQNVARLVLVNATPRFTQAPGWDCAVAPAALRQFAQDLEQDYSAALARFLSLQFGDSERERDVLRRLRADLLHHGGPEVAALRAGLRILEETDLRAALPAIRAPALVVHGGRDRLVPPQAAEFLAAQLPRARLAVVAGAGHAPFLSHPEAFRHELGRFLNERI